MSSPDSPTSEQIVAFYNKYFLLKNYFGYLKSWSQQCFDLGLDVQGDPCFKSSFADDQQNMVSNLVNEAESMNVSLKGINLQ